MRRVSIHHLTWILATSPVLIAQDLPPSPPAYFNNIAVNADGHVCYTEPFEGGPMNRVEYTTNGKGVLRLYASSENEDTMVEASDFDNDGHADLLYVMRAHHQAEAEVIHKVNYYRGAVYADHLKRHYGHALLTGSHPLIKDRPEEQERRRSIERSIDQLNALHVGSDEIGIFTADHQFHPIDTKFVRDAFGAADTLSLSIRAILAGDVRTLSKPADITKRHTVEIEELLAIEPGGP